MHRFQVTPLFSKIQATLAHLIVALALTDAAIAQGVNQGSSGNCSPNIHTQGNVNVVCPGDQGQWTGLVELAALIDNLAIAANVDYTGYDWFELQRRSSGIKWPDRVTMTDSKTCYFRMIGKASFLIGGRVLLHGLGTRPAEWEVYACGVRSIVTSISFDVKAFEYRRVDEIFTSVRDGLRDKGYKLERVGCQGIQTEKTSSYHVTRPSSRPFNLEAYVFDSSVGPTVNFSFGFSPKRTLSGCAERFDLLQAVAVP